MTHSIIVTHPKTGEADYTVSAGVGVVEIVTHGTLFRTQYLSAEEAWELAQAIDRMATQAARNEVEYYARRQSQEAPCSAS